MRIVKNPFEYVSEDPCAVTIGKFDGLHRGHRALITETVRNAARLSAGGRRCLSCVFTFDNSPAMILSRKERRSALEKMGVDLLIECDFGPRVISTTADDFISGVLARRLRAVSVAAGEDFRFGYKRTGDAGLLLKRGGEYGFEVDIIPEILEDGVKISSTDIRECVLRGDMERAERLLGFPYYIRGRVIQGNQIGRTIGIPTANMIPDRSKLLPPNGVYFSETVLDGKPRRGITNIGTKPTVDGQFIGVETYFFDTDGDLYGKNLTLSLRHFSRPERKFGSLEELKARIEKDREEGRAFFLDTGRRG